MATLVGTQDAFEDALFELCELDYDAVEAYQAAIERLENEEYKNQLRHFKQDHQRHTEELSNLLRSHGAQVPDGPSAKQLLAKGKVVLANLFGDSQILKAMLTNEEDTNTAYERLNQHSGKWSDAVSILKRGLEDEQRHKSWIESQVGIKV